MTNIGIDFLLLRIAVINRIKRINLDIIFIAIGLWWWWCHWRPMQLNGTTFTVDFDHFYFLFLLFLFRQRSTSNHHFYTFRSGMSNSWTLELIGGGIEKKINDKWLLLWINQSNKQTNNPNKHTLGFIVGGSSFVEPKQHFTIVFIRVCAAVPESIHGNQSLLHSCLYYSIALLLQ